VALLERLQILIDADARGAQKEFESIGKAAEREVSKAERSVDRLGKKMQSVGSVTAIGGAAVVGGFAMLAKAADQADRELLKLDNSIKNSDQAFSRNGKSLTDLAGALQQKTAADADAIIGSQSLLVQFGLTESQVKTLTPLVVDLSRKMGVDLDQAAKAVGKAVEGNAGALGKMGIQLDSTKLKADGFGTVVEGLRGSVAGFAQQEGQTFSGQLERLKNNLGDIGESVGKGAAGVLGGLTQGAADLAKQLNEVNPGILAAVGGIGATGGVVATLAGGFAFAAGKAVEFSQEVRKGNTALVKIGDDGERSLTKVGKAASGIAIVGAVAGIIETVATVANASNDIDRKLTRAFDGVRSSLKGTEEEAAKAFATLVEVEDQTARFSGLWEGFGSEFKLGNISADVEEFNRAFDNVLDNLGPEAASKIVAGLEAQNKALNENSDQYRTNAEIIADAKDRTQERAEALKIATVAERDQKKAIQEAVAEYDRQSATIEGVKNALTDFSGKLKLLRLDYDANSAAAKGFGDAIERSSTLDDQVGAALSFNDALKKSRDTLKDLPRDIDPIAVAFFGVGDAANQIGEEAVKSFLAIGDAAKGLLTSFIQAGDPDGARKAAAALRFQIVTSLKEQNFSPEEIDKYLNLAGVSERQVELSIKAGNVEAELLRIQTVLSLFQTELENSPPELRLRILTQINEGDIAGAVRTAQDFVTGTPVTVAINPDAAPVYNELEAVKASIDATSGTLQVLAATQTAQNAIQSVVDAANKAKVSIPVTFNFPQGSIGSLFGLGQKSQAPGQFFGPGGRDGDPRTPFARGGYVPGVGDKDTVPAVLTPGEFVVTKDAAQRLGPRALAQVNAGQVPDASPGVTVGSITINQTDNGEDTAREVVRKMRDMAFLGA
jgi:DNA-binding transcriptional MerR regulator